MTRQLRERSKTLQPWPSATAPTKDSSGTVSLVIEGVDKVGRLRADNVVPGSPDDQSVYRNELAGLYGIVLAVSLVCKVHGVTGGQVEIGCDGLSALQQSFHPDNIPNAPTAPQFDLICAIRRVAKQCPVVWLPRHFDGHQDNHLTAILDRHALSNIEMDVGAKALMFFASTDSRSRSSVQDFWRTMVNLARTQEIE